MNNLVPFAGDAFARFDAIVAAKRPALRGRLTTLRPHLRARMHAYAVAVAALERLPLSRLTQAEKADLLHCYEVPTAPLNRLCTAIVRQQQPNIQAVCQYCGVNPYSAGFDHYLPKEKFAEFSAWATNLLPCCAACNTKKGATWLVSGRRRIINLYYDQLPQSQYLRATLVYRQGVPVASFRLDPNPQLYDGKFRLIRAHFKKLRLKSVYRKASVVFLSEERATVLTLRPTFTIGQLSQFFRSRAAKLRQDFSPNYWKAALLDAIADSDEYLRQA